MRNEVKLSAIEAESILTVCLLAAFADGGKNEIERSAIKSIMENLPSTKTNHAALYQRVLLGQISLTEAAQPLEPLELRQLAYEMALCVCEADDLLTPPEKRFLEQLRSVLHLAREATYRMEKDAAAVAFPDFAAAESAIAGRAGKTTVVGETTETKANDVDGMILNYSMLNGALELMPQSLSTLAIIPLQMKMVYRIGKRYGYDLDRGHIKELLAAAGIGLTSQVLEGYVTKLFGGLFRKVGGKIGRSVAGQATSSAMSFAATYALGYVAQNYYAGGRALSSIEMRQLFDKFKSDAAAIHSRYAAQIQQQAREIDAARLLALVRGNDQEKATLHQPGGA